MITQINSTKTRTPVPSVSSVFVMRSRCACFSFAMRSRCACFSQTLFCWCFANACLRQIFYYTNCTEILPLLVWASQRGVHKLYFADEHLMPVCRPILYYTNRTETILPLLVSASQLCVHKLSFVCELL